MIHNFENDCTLKAPTTPTACCLLKHASVTYLLF